MDGHRRAELLDDRGAGEGVAGTEAIVQVWVFVVGPLLGGAIAGATYGWLFGEARVRAGSFAAPVGAVPGYGAPDQYQQQWIINLIQKQRGNILWYSMQMMGNMKFLIPSL